MIKKILIANRGEIALRIIKTCQECGIKTVTVYTDIEKELPHAFMGDENINLGSGALSETYLNMNLLLDIAKDTGADAIHPGYGFLSENSKFAQAVSDAGLVFIGPTPESMILMGDKTGSKRKMKELDIPLIPGYHGDNQDEKQLEIESTKILIEQQGTLNFHIVQADSADENSTSTENSDKRQLIRKLKRMLEDAAKKRDVEAATLYNVKAQEDIFLGPDARKY